MPDDPILESRDGAVLTLILNDPPRNPISLAMVDHLERRLPQIDADKSVRAVIVTGAGESGFSVGANIKEFAAGVSKMSLEGMIGQRIKVLGMVENLSKPVIAAVHGTCLGGGLELALCCHLRLCSEGARFALPEIELGIVPAWSGTQRLPPVVGRARALEMMLLGRHVSAAEAFQMGLVNAVHPAEKLLPETQALARELSEKAPLAAAEILKAVIQGDALSLEKGLALELDAVRRTSGSRDNLEGINAFFQKRKPIFKGE